MITATSIRRWWWPLLFLVVGALAAEERTALAAEQRQPNVILILIDDMGWRDVGFMGNSFVETPTLDALARSGLVFTQAYASAPQLRPDPRLLDVGTGDAPPRRLSRRRSASAPRIPLAQAPGGGEQQ